MRGSMVGSSGTSRVMRFRRSLGVRALVLVFAAAAGLVGTDACATPPESDLIAGLPCDHGACASGFECDTTTGTCLAPAPPGTGAVDGGPKTGSGGRSGGSGGVPAAGASENGGDPETGGAASGGALGTGGKNATGGAGTGGGQGGAGGIVVGGSGGNTVGAGGSSSGGATGVSCDDGSMNGAETALDCGGPTCNGCSPGASCDIDLDCTSRKCAPGDAGRGKCLAPTCGDGIVNGLETGADCGGACTTCADGATCHVNADCTSRHCLLGTCAASACLDGQKDGTESDLDCGGSACPLCQRGATCRASSDCTSGVCRPLGGSGGKVCLLPSCSDGVKNGAESDRDCGGAACSVCAAGKLCTQAGDCESGSCVRVYSLMVCQP